MRTSEEAYMMSLNEFTGRHISQEMNETPQNELIRMEKEELPMSVIKNRTVIGIYNPETRHCIYSWPIELRLTFLL